MRSFEWHLNCLGSTIEVIKIQTNITTRGLNTLQKLACTMTLQRQL